MVRILAIDVGIKNMSYCLLETGGKPVESRPRIVQWKNISVLSPSMNCKTTSLDCITESMLLKLGDHFDSDCIVDTVVIENQPATKNQTMKSVSMVIYTYFHMLRLQYGQVEQVRFSPATNKLKCKKRFKAPFSSLPQKTYAQRKSLAVRLTKGYLEEWFDTNTNTLKDLEWFDAQKKKDDLSDAFLLAVYHAEKLH
jgi:hypothetical protein